MRREVNVNTGEETTHPDYEPPDPEVIDFDALDQATLNRILIEDGSVVRAGLELLFGVIKGVIPIDPTITKAQFITLLKNRMRT